jgi:hypothetical protein
MSGSVEGGNATGLMRILRHEAGHVVDSLQVASPQALA